MIKAHGGQLVNKLLEEDQNLRQAQVAEEKAKDLYSLVLEDRYISDCEMIAIGGFSPLTGFMDKAETESVLEKVHLPNGLLWSIPILLPVESKDEKNLTKDQEVALIDKNKQLIAILKVKEKFTLEADYYCQQVYKTTDIEHPGVKVIKERPSTYLAGEISLVNRPQREEIQARYYLDPTQTREEFAYRGWQTIVAFQTRNPVHRAHEYIIKSALEPLDGALIHPLVGATKKDDIPANVRMQCYLALMGQYFNLEHTMLTVLPAAMHYAGPREAIHHALLRKNYGCTHIIIGRDHAGVGDYYGTYEAQELVSEYEDELGIKPLNFEHSYYCKKCQTFASTKTCRHQKEDRIHLSGSKVREMLKNGQDLPEEFSRREVARFLREWGGG